ncbi:hypothetical protein JTB14_022874 [Gonioctena quinquepunctata]|nr:hypothetical protein JTB14_022874 [Gonioctena quinquepunctata]
MLNSQPDEAAVKITLQFNTSIQSREHKEFNDFYNLSKFDEKCPEVAELDEEELDNIHSDLRNKYGSQSSQRSNEDVDLNQHFDIEIEAYDLVDCATPKKVVNNINELKSPKKCMDIIHTDNTKDVSTPSNNFIMKTTDVTPMVNYDQMDTPSIRKELDKFGMKPLKRQRAIKLLKHIYESTHPLVSSTGISSPDQAEEEVEERAVKRRKTIDLADTDLVGEEELIFERKISSKVVSCRLPLQIAWYNFVSENIELQDNILLYEPIHLEIVHCMLKEQSGCKFHVEDLITFLDRKCITFRTTQSQGARTKK